MVSVAEHYEKHLAPVYVWMAGGVDSAIARAEPEVESLVRGMPQELVAVDLGAGFGMHAIPLARRGHAVIAIDESALLLETLREQARALDVRAVQDDIRAFPRYLEDKAHLVLCMGDTLTHLPDPQAVTELFVRIAGSLRPGGRAVFSFRDYSVALTGEWRFIPVRSDADRILTCFLEYMPDHVTVHDVIHERTGEAWQLRVSAYRKLRLSVAWVTEALGAAGFQVHVEPGLGGMARIVGELG